MLNDFKSKITSFTKKKKSKGDDLGDESEVDSEFEDSTQSTEVSDDDKGAKGSSQGTIVDRIKPDTSNKTEKVEDIDLGDDLDSEATPKKDGSKVSAILDKFKAKLNFKKNKSEDAETTDQEDLYEELEGKSAPVKKGLLETIKRKKIVIVVVLGLGVLVYEDALKMLGLIEEPVEVLPVSAPPSKRVKPAPTEPAPTELAPTEPAPTEPVPTEPVPTDPVPTDPVPTKPAPTDPAPTDPVPMDPVPTEPVPTEPAPTDPVPTDPVPTEPVPTEPVDPIGGEVITPPADGGGTDTEGEMTEQILQDLEKQVNMKKERKQVTQYVSPPDYEFKGRGLVYNCQGKHWACVDGASYRSCEDNHSSIKYLGRKVECYPFNVYETLQGCEWTQNRLVSSNAKTDFCKEN